MAKKFVRGVTGVDDIDKLDKSLTNVNDLVSDGQNTYVHTKKGKDESYYKLTDSVKQVKSSDETLTITKYNDTVTITNKSLATKQELTGKQDKLTTGDGLAIENNKVIIKPTENINPLNVNGLYKGTVLGDNQSSSIISLELENTKNVQLRFRESVTTAGQIVMLYRFVNNGVATSWKLAAIDKYAIDQQLAQKQNTITNNTSIGVSGTGLQQLYTNKQTYSHANGILKTHIKSISANTSVTTAEDEFNFVVKINKGATSATFTLNPNDTTKFNNIMNTYGQNNSVNISDCVFTLSGSNLTVTTANNVNNNYVITFSDII